MRKRRTGYELDLSDSLIDLCCCALGGFVLLLVLVLPEPTKPPSPETLPIRRTVEFKIQIPVMAGMGVDPPSEFSFVRNRLFPVISLAKGEIILTVAGDQVSTAFNPISIPSAPIESQCSLGLVTIHIERLEATHIYSSSGDTEKGWADNWKWGEYPSSNLICTIAVVSRPGQIWDESFEFQLNAIIETPKARWPLELLPDTSSSFTSNVLIASKIGSETVGLNNNRLFPALGVVLRPEGARQFAGMASVPAFARNNDEWVGAVFHDRKSYESELPGSIVDEQKIWPSASAVPPVPPVDWRTTNQALPKASSTRSITFDLQWTGVVGFSQQDSEDELQPPEIELTFDCTAS